MGFFDGLAGTLFGPVVSGISSIFQNQSNLKAQRQMLERQYQMQNEMWQKQTEYDKPINQVNRMVEANLNPNLMYGQGTTGNSAGFPSAPSPSVPNLQNPLQSFGDLNIAQANANVENTRADSNLKNAEAENMREQKGVITETKTALKIANYVADNAKDIDIETKELLKQQIQNSVYISGYEAGIANIKTQYGLNSFYMLMPSEDATDEQKQEIEEHNRKAQQLVDRLGESVALEIMTGQMMYDQMQNSMDIAKIGANASVLSSQIGAAASKYAADKHLEGIIKQLKANEDIRTMTALQLFASAYTGFANGDMTNFKRTCLECGINPDNNSEIGSLLNYVHGLRSQLLKIVEKGATGKPISPRDVFVNAGL